MQIKRVEITLNKEAREQARIALQDRGLLAVGAPFFGPVFDVDKPKPGEAMTKHKLDCYPASNFGVAVVVTYESGRKEDYLYPAHTVARVKVVRE